LFEGLIKVKRIKDIFVFAPFN